VLEFVEFLFAFVSSVEPTSALFFGVLNSARSLLSVPFSFPTFSFNKSFLLPSPEDSVRDDVRGILALFSVTAAPPFPAPAKPFSGSVIVSCSCVLLEDGVSVVCKLADSPSPDALFFMIEIQLEVEAKWHSPLYYSPQ
jgi:hypothetical protein